MPIPDSGREDLPAYAVVLSAYDGGPYVEQQLESIRAQTAPCWRLYMRDDGSGDDTAGRLARWARGEPRATLLAADGRNLGPAASFGVLLEHALAAGERYVFLSDQDDVWMPGKCARMLAALRARESEVGSDMPLLVHSDLRVVDRDLTVVNDSFVRLLRIEAGERHGGARLFWGNSITGCATLVNAALLRCALPMPVVAMHDWWLGQCAAAFGEVVFLDEPTVLYRQHGANVVGARGLRARAASAALAPGAWWDDSARRFLAGLRQLWTIRARARARGLRVGEEIAARLEVLWRGLGERHGSPASRVRAARRCGALPRAFPMRALLLARVALLPALRTRLGDEREGIAESAR